MMILNAEQTAAALPFDRLIPALRDAFISGARCRCVIATTWRSPTEPQRRCC